MPLKNLKGIELGFSYEGLYGKFVDSENMCNCYQGLKEELNQINFIYGLLKYIWNSEKTALGSLNFIVQLEEMLEIKCDNYENTILEMKLKEHNGARLCSHCLSEVIPMPDDRIKRDLFYCREKLINKAVL